MTPPARPHRLARVAASLICVAALAACSPAQPPQAPATHTATPPDSTGGAAPTSASPTPSSSSGALPALTIAGRWTADHAGGGAIAAAVGAGKLWVGYALSGGSSGRMHGELVGYDLRSGRAAVRVEVGAFPVALAASAGGVWVANGVGDGSQAGSAHLDSVERFSTSGTLVSTVQVANPVALAASGERAWVYYTSDARPRVRLLATQAGSAAASGDTALPGQPVGGRPGTSPLVACGEGVYAVSTGGGSNSVTLSRVGSAGTPLARVTADAAIPSLACTEAGGPVLVLGGQPSVVVSAETHYRAVPLRSGADVVVAGAGTRLWLAGSGTGAVSVSTIDDAGTATSTAVRVSPSEASPMLASDGSGVWVVVPSVSTGSATIQVEHLTAPPS